MLSNTESQLAAGSLSVFSESDATLRGMSSPTARVSIVAEGASRYGVIAPGGVFLPSVSSISDIRYTVDFVFVGPINDFGPHTHTHTQLTTARDRNKTKTEAPHSAVLEAVFVVANQAVLWYWQGGLTRRTTGVYTWRASTRAP